MFASSAQGTVSAELHCETLQVDLNNGSQLNKLLPASDISDSPAASVILPCHDGRRHSGCEAVCNLIRDHHGNIMMTEGRVGHGQFEVTRSDFHNLSARPSPSKSRQASCEDVLSIVRIDANSEAHFCVDEKRSVVYDISQNSRLPAAVHDNQALGDSHEFSDGPELPPSPTISMNETQALNLHRTLIPEPAVVTTSGLLETVSHAMEDWLQQELSFEGSDGFGRSFTDSLLEPWPGGEEAQEEGIFDIQETILTHCPSRSQPTTISHVILSNAAMVTSEEDCRQDATTSSFAGGGGAGADAISERVRADGRADGDAGVDADAEARPGANAGVDAGAGDGDGAAAARADVGSAAAADVGTGPGTYLMVSPTLQPENLPRDAHVISEVLEPLPPNECHLSIGGDLASVGRERMKKEAPHTDVWKDGEHSWRLLQAFASRGYLPTAAKPGRGGYSKVHPRSRVQQLSDVHPICHAQPTSRASTRPSSATQQSTCQSATLEHPCQQWRRPLAPAGAALQRLLLALCGTDVSAEQSAVQCGDAMQAGAWNSEMMLRQVGSHRRDSDEDECGRTVREHTCDLQGYLGEYKIVQEQGGYSKLNGGCARGLKDGVHKSSNVQGNGSNVQLHGCSSQEHTRAEEQWSGVEICEDDAVQPLNQLQQMLDSFHRRLQSTVATTPMLPDAAAGAAGAGVAGAGGVGVGRARAGVSGAGVGAAAVRAAGTTAEAAVGTAEGSRAAAPAAVGALAETVTATAAGGQTRDSVMCRGTSVGSLCTLDERHFSGEEEAGVSKLARLCAVSQPSSCSDERDISDKRSRGHSAEDMGNQQATCSAAISAIHKPERQRNGGGAGSITETGIAVGSEGSPNPSSQSEVMSGWPLRSAGGLCVAASKAAFPWLQSIQMHPSVQGQREQRLVAKLLGLAEAIVGQDAVR